MDFAPKEVVAVRLRALRAAKNLAQHEVASLLGVRQPAVCAWEDARYLPKRELWGALAELLGTTREELFYQDDSKAVG